MTQNTISLENSDIDSIISEVFPDNTPSETTVEGLVARIQNNPVTINTITSRFNSADWYNKILSKKVLLAGLGGIGSYVAFLLSRLNIKHLLLFDDDVVEEANLSGQLFSKNNIGLTKVDAVADTLEQFSNFNRYHSISEKYQSTYNRDIMICGFDNMSARKEFFESWLNHVREYPVEERNNCLFIDGRLNAEEFQVLCLRGDDDYNITRYSKEFLFDDSEVEDTICSYKQTTFMANMIGSVIVNLFVNFVANQCNPIIDRDLPFFTSYNAAQMYFKTNY